MTHNNKHTILINKTKFTPYCVPPAHAPASVCRDLEGGEAIGHREVIFLSGGVSGVDTFEEKVTVPMDNLVL